MPALALLLLAAALRVVYLVTLLAAAESDAERRIIPNRLVLVVFGTGVALRLVTDPLAIWINMLVAGAVYVGLAVLANLNLLGGGDVKMTAAATFLVPAADVPELLLDIALAGGVVSLLYLVARKISIVNSPTVPYGVAILGGVTYRIIADTVRCFGATSCWS
jgi:prepilin peptidase CpaA